MVDNLSFNRAAQRLDEVVDSANKIIELSSSATDSQINADAVRARITTIRDRANADMVMAKFDQSTFNKEVKSIRSHMIKEIGKVISEYQLGLLTTYGSRTDSNLPVPTELKKHFRNLVLNNSKGMLLRFAAKLSTLGPFKAENPQQRGLIRRLDNARRTVEAFQEGMKKLQDDIGLYENEMPGIKENALDSDQLNKFVPNPKKAFKRNAGVILHKGSHYILPMLTPHGAAKQINSLIAQKSNLNRRSVFSRIIEFADRKYTAKFVPLNQEFDQVLYNESVKARGQHIGAVNTDKYETLFGDRGAGSAYREVEHVMNGYLTTLGTIDQSDEVVQVNQVLRHGILAMRFETDPAKRLEVARQMTRELLTAAVLIGIAKSGKSLDEVAERGTPWKQGVISVSLVTPDMWRDLGEAFTNLFKTEKLQSSEAAMWKSQLEAFNYYDAVKDFKLVTKDGKEIAVEFDILPFNTGVNAGAVKAGLGAFEQWKNVKTKVARLEKMAKDLKAADLDGDHSDIDRLLKDVKVLTRTPISYLRHQNQYELGAKLEILGNRLEELAGYGKAYDSVVSMLNCMSAKDRTGVELAVAYTFEEMRKQLDHYPSVKEMEDPKNQDEFVHIFVKMLQEYGGMDIGEINTNARGYKVGKEVIVYPNAKAWEDYPGIYQMLVGMANTAGA